MKVGIFFPFLCSVAILGLLASDAKAQDPVQIQAFPMEASSASSFPGLQLTPNIEGLAALAEHSSVQLAGVPLPDGNTVDLDLKRVPLIYPPGGITVNGVQDPTTLQGLDLTLWKGQVLDAPGSDVFLALSRHGSHGWIRTEQTFHITAGSNEELSGNRVSYIRTEESMLELELRPDFTCDLDSVQQPNLDDMLKNATSGFPSSSRGTTLLPLKECRIAVETDNQFYDLFGNFNSARNYLVALMSAVSDRYREQVGTILTYPYMSIYPNGINDPWSTQESGGGSGDLLNEFRERWDNGAAPVQADLYHFVSGDNLGGGVAYGGVLCHQSYGFAVSGNIHTDQQYDGDGQAIPNQSFNWPFVVIAHELGHNFSSPHTHSFCPPIDECAPEAYWGQCQSNTACINTGTILSYCHLCSGGMSNVTTFFHPAVVNTMRNHVNSSCLPDFRGVFPVNLGFSLPGSNGNPKLEISYSKNRGELDLDVTRAPLNRTGYMIASFDAVYRPFRGSPPGTLVPRLDDFVRPTRTGPNGAVSLSADTSPFSFPTGTLIWAQMWIPDPQGPSGWAATNGVEFELILP